MASNTACSRFDAVSSGPIIRKLSGLARITSRSHVPSTAVALDRAGAGLGHVDGVAVKSGSRRSRSSSPPLACGVALIRSVTARVERAQLRDAAGPSSSNSSSGR